MFTYPTSVRMVTHCSPGTAAPRNAVPVSGSHDSENARLLDEHVTAVSQIPPGGSALLTNSRGEILTGADPISQACEYRNTSLRLVVADAFTFTSDVQKKSLLFEVDKPENTDVLINMANMHNLYRALPQPVLQASSSSSSSSTDIPDSSLDAPLPMNRDSAMKILGHPAFTFDGACAALAYLYPRCMDYEAKGLLPPGSISRLDAIRRVLLSVTCSGGSSSEADAEAWLQEWATVNRFRKQRNSEEAHPLGGGYAEELICVLQEAVGIQHPMLAGFPRVASMAVTTTAAAMEERRQQVATEQTNLAAIRRYSWV